MRSTSDTLHLPMDDRPDQPANGRDGPEDNDAGAGISQPVFNIATPVLVLIAINVAIHGIRTYWLDPDTDIDLLLETAFIPARYSPAEVGFSLSWLTSPITYAFLHGGMAHLGFNMLWLAIFGSPLAARLGTRRFVAFYLGAILAAAATHFALYSGSTALLIGASGGVSGVTGAAARFAFRVSRNDGVRGFSGPLLPIGIALRIPMVLVFCAVWMGVNFLTGAGILTPDGSGPIAWEAHVGGFLFGFLLVAFFDPLSGRPATH